MRTVSHAAAAVAVAGIAAAETAAGNSCPGIVTVAAVSAVAAGTVADIVAAGHHLVQNPNLVSPISLGVLN